MEKVDYTHDLLEKLLKYVDRVNDSHDANEAPQAMELILSNGLTGTFRWGPMFLSQSTGYVPEDTMVHNAYRELTDLMLNGEVNNSLSPIPMQMSEIAQPYLSGLHVPPDAAFLEQAIKQLQGMGKIEEAHDLTMLLKSDWDYFTPPSCLGNLYEKHDKAKYVIFVPSSWIGR